MTKNNFLIVTEDDWKSLTTDQREWLFYNTLKNMDQRLSVLEKKKMTDKVIVFLGNFCGSIAIIGGLVWAKIKIF